MAHVKTGNEGSGIEHDIRKSYKCKIPLRMGPGRLRPPCKSKFHNSDQIGRLEVNRLEVANTPRNFQASRPRSAEARVKEEPGSQPRSYTPAHPMQLARQSRPDRERSVPALKRPSYTPRRMYDLNNGHKNGRQVLMVSPHKCEFNSERHSKNGNQSEDLNSYTTDYEARSEAAHILDSREEGSIGQDIGKNYKCKIPLRLSPGRTRPPYKSKFNNSDQASRPRSADMRDANSYIVDGARSEAAHTLDSKKEGRKFVIYKKLCPNPNNLDKFYIIDEISTNDECHVKLSDHSDKVMRLRILWKDKLLNFELMKRNLIEIQRSLVDHYEALLSLREEMAEVAEQVRLPPIQELHDMNVTKMIPPQWLQLCEASTLTQTQDINQHGLQKGKKTSTTLPMDVEVLYRMPNTIISTCEQTLLGREQMICWVEEMISQKMITKNALVKKVEQFKHENAMFKRNLDSNKNEIMQNINDAVEILKQSVSDAVTNQLRSEELICKLSELSSMNENLRKQLRTTEHRVSNKAKLEELEKEFKEEKRKKMQLKDRLSRAEGQLKMKEDKVNQLEAAWEQAQAKSMELERTVYQLREENRMLNAEYDKKVQILSESVQKNIQHLEDIAAERERLTNEKKDLENRLSELSEHYKDSLKEVKHENSVQIAKLIENEKKHNEVLEEKVKLESKVENLCAQLIESELRVKDLSKRLTAAEGNLSNAAENRKEMDTNRRALDRANNELLTLQNLLTKKTEDYNDLESNFKKSVEAEEMLRSKLNIKEEYISELEKQRTLLEQRLKESENKLGFYADELSNFKAQISRLLKDFGEFETLEELHKMVEINHQQLREATEQKNALAQALKTKEEQMEQQMEAAAEAARALEQRETMLATLAEKDEEQANIIKLLRTNLEIRAQADVDLNQQIVEKSNEIESLIGNLEARKEQILQLEKIVLALEEQTRKSNTQKQKDKDTILLLEKKLSEYESYIMANGNGRNHDNPADNLDNLINMLENELGNPFDGEPNNRDSRNSLPKQRNELSKREKHIYEGNNGSIYQSPRENRPTKIVMGNYVKKTYIANEDQHKHESLNRKKAITSMQTEKWLASHDPEFNVQPKLKDKQLPSFKVIPGRNPYSLLPNHLVDEKKCKMFKFAGHRL